MLMMALFLSRLLGTLDCKAAVIYALVYDAQTPCLLAATDDGCPVWNFNKHRKPTNRLAHAVIYCK